MLRCEEAFSWGSIATRALESSAQPCRLASTPTVITTRPIIFALIMGIRSCEMFARWVREADLHDARRVTRSRSGALPRRARPDTFPRAPNRPHAPGRGADARPHYRRA